MSLHPQAKAMIEALKAGPALDYETLTAARFRELFEVPAPIPGHRPAARIEDRVLETNGRSMRVRLYYPDGPGPFPMTLFLHGGGFVIGSPDMTDAISSTLAVGARSLIISPNYRLAPESPFPLGLQDAMHTLEWAHHMAAELGGLAGKIAVAGDSSGGNFAAVLAQMSRASGPALCHQLLLYPVIDCRFDTQSYRDFGEGYFLSAAMMRWFWRQYLPDPLMASDWRASPSRQPNLAGLPDATIVSAEYDVLRDEAEAYAAALSQAGVAVTLKRWPGQIHGFLLQQGLIDDAELALKEAGRLLRAAFDRV